MKKSFSITNILSGAEAWEEIYAHLNASGMGDEMIREFIGYDPDRNTRYFVAIFDDVLPDHSAKVGAMGSYFRADTPEEYAEAVEHLPAFLTPVEWDEWAKVLCSNVDADPIDQEPAIATEECAAFIGAFKRLWLSKWAPAAGMDISPMAIPEGTFFASLVKEMPKGESTYRVYSCCLDAAAACGFMEPQTHSFN